MRDRPLVGIVLVTAASVDVRPLGVEFPTVRVECSRTPPIGVSVIDGARWAEAQRFTPFDELVESAAEVLAVRTDETNVALEVLTRYQRFVDRRNEHSEGKSFENALAAHRSLHDVKKPLVKADLDHALDTWQWMLRLDPKTSLALQLAALFHDVERLESEADVRVEHHAADYQAFKDAHAIYGAERAYDILRNSGIDERTAARVRTIVARHERRRGNPEIDLLNDADALSFFSLNSPGYLDYFGTEQTRRKVRWTLERMGARARARLSSVRLRPDVHRLLVEAEAA